MRCESPPPQSPGGGAPRPARAATAARRWLPWEALTSRPGSSCLPLQSPGTTGSGSPAAPFSLALPRQGEETPWVRCCSSESAAPQGRSPFPFAPPAAPGHGLSSRNRPAPRYPSCAPAEAVATQGLPMLWERSRPPAAHCQQHRFSRGNSLLLQLTSTASPHLCPGHHTLFAPSTKSEGFESQPGRNRKAAGEHREGRGIFRVFMGVKMVSQKAATQPLLLCEILEARLEAAPWQGAQWVPAAVAQHVKLPALAVPAAVAGASLPSLLSLLAHQTSAASSKTRAFPILPASSPRAGAGQKCCLQQVINPPPHSSQEQAAPASAGIRGHSPGTEKGTPVPSLAGRS